MGDDSEAAEETKAEPTEVEAAPGIDQVGGERSMESSREMLR